MFLKQTGAPRLGAARVFARLAYALIGVLVAVLAAAWIMPAAVQAGTITIVDGPNTPPVNGVYTDGYIQAQLAAANLIIDTSAGAGPDEIRVLQGAEIKWTTGRTLTLDAGASIVITGTIQHDGPNNGAGGLTLLAPDGAVIVGTGNQTAGVAAGSRFGLTRVEADNLILKGANSGTQPYAHLGFRAVNKAAPYTVTGAISVTVSHNLTATGGSQEYAYVQIGHCGANADFSLATVVNCRGAVSVETGGDVTFVAGGNFAFAQLGNGGYWAAGTHDGSHRLHAGGDVTFQANPGLSAYAMMGNGTVEAGGVLGGSHTLTAGGNVTFLGGDSTFAHAQLGNRGSSSGDHSLTAGGNVTFRAGDSFYAYAQMGNSLGGNDNPGGNQTLVAGGDVLFEAGETAHAQLGNGGSNQSGSHTLTSGGDVSFRAGGNESAYAQLGNGGGETAGNHSGGHYLNAEGDVTFVGGGGFRAQAQMGNGGYFAVNGQSGDHSGDHTLIAGGNVVFAAGLGQEADAQFGNGGWRGSHSGSHSLAAGGDVSFRGGSFYSYAHFGNGGDGAGFDYSGDHSLTAGRNVTFRGGGSHSYSQFGNGRGGGNHRGSHILTAGGDVILQGGDTFAYAQIGNGGYAADGNFTGNLTLTITGSLTMSAGNDPESYTMIGHGSDVRGDLDLLGTGSRSGDVILRVGETAVFSGSQVGHLTANGPISVTQGNTLIGVSQNQPVTGTGQLLVTGVTTTSFTSAPTANGGELRFYLPREENQQIPTNALFNSESFVTANIIPPAQLAGVALFGAGPYIPDYSFYLGSQPDVAITKTATPTDTVQSGAALTYTISFSNTGTGTATGVVISDALSNILTGTVVSLSPDSGVVISETSAAPNLVWTVSDLAPGQGGQIELAVTVAATAEVGSTITNTVTINATGDANAENNIASVANEVSAPDASGNVYLPVLQR